MQNSFVVMSDQQPMMADQIVYRLTKFRLLLKCYFHPCMLTGPPGSCKSEATKCALSLFGAHETHSYNNHRTSLTLPVKQQYQFVSMM